MENPDDFLAVAVRLTCAYEFDSLRKAQEDIASLTPEYVAANMSTEEAQRLSRVRNIGIAVRAIGHGYTRAHWKC